MHVHAREPLYSNSAVVAGWFQATRAQNSVSNCKEGSIFVNILLLKTFFVDYCHIFLAVYLLNNMYVYVLEFMLTLDKMQNISTLSNLWAEHLESN